MGSGASGSSASQQQVPWIAVLPFRNRSSDPTFQTLGEDLAEEIITGLSRFKLYHVVAAAATIRFQGESAEMQEMARDLANFASGGVTVLFTQRTSDIVVDTE